MPLPTFLILGERKSGTTALCRWMAHPDLYMLPREDLNYFIEDEILVTRVWREGEADAERWGRTHSPDRYSALFDAARSHTAIGEKSADLFFWKPAHERIARFLPECKFIVLLRHPVRRAWSHYLDELAKGEGRESLSFHDALACERERASRSAYARLHLSYRERGYYGRSALSFLRHIPASRVLFLTMEGMAASPRETLQQVYQFIGIDPTIGLERAGTRHNEGGATDIPRPWARSRPVKPIATAYHRVAASVAERLLSDPARCQRFKDVVYLPFRKSGKRMAMSEPTRADLGRVYGTHVPELSRIVGREFAEWKF